MPVVKFLACLDLERKSSFLDGHYAAAGRIFNPVGLTGQIKKNYLQPRTELE